MTADPDLLRQALELDPVARAELVDALLASFDADGATAVEAAWGREAESRIDAYEAGALPARPARDVFAKIAGHAPATPSPCIGGIAWERRTHKRRVAPCVVPSPIKSF